MQIEQVPLDTLRPYENNPRINDHAVESLAESIRQFGWTQPIVIDGNKVIVAGHTRYKAARLLGEKLVPCLTASQLTDEQVKAYRLLDNKLASQSNWDADLLRIELTALEDFDLEPFNIDFKDDLPKVSEPESNADDDYIPEPPAEPFTRPGDIWHCGKHRIVCGDATTQELIPGEILLTDPPYCSGGRQDGTRRNASSIGSRTNEKLSRDDLTTRGYLALMRRVLELFQGDELYVFTDWRMWQWTFDTCEEAGYPVRNMLVWAKPTMGMGFPWRSQHELVCFAKQTASTLQSGKHGNVLQCKRSGNKNHPTEKPLELIMTILGNTEEDRSVCDTFLGSGTTLIAAQRLGRLCSGYEVNPAYVDVACRRYYAETNELPVRDGDGVVFPIEETES